MKGYRITFIRHGYTQGNIDGKYIGVTDLPLAKEGAEELYEIIEKAGYPSFQKVYISPLKRCLQTAYIMAPSCYTVELPQLREMDFGKFENKTPEELKDDEDYKKFLEGGLDNPPPGGESARQVVTRCFDALSTIVGDMMEEGLTNTAVITHSGIIMNMMACFGLPKRKPIEYACGFGEGFEVLITASMWQRSGAFEIIGTFPPTESYPEDDYAYGEQEHSGLE
ncbi:MAG: histidine phosphatase family protein [Oscillospiraceae bacterium]